MNPRIAFACLVASLFVGCSAPPQAVVAATVPAVAVAKAGMQDMSHSLTLTAEFRPYQEIDVMAKVAGYVRTISVDVGDRVQEGQLLAILEVPEMADDEARAQSMVSRSQAEVTHANDELRRAESAHEIVHLTYTRLAEVAKQKVGLVAPQEVDDAHSKDLVAEGQVTAARSNVATAEQQVQVSNSELRRTKTMAEYLRVTAPFTGIVTKRFADKGSMIQAGTSSNTQAMPLIRLSQNNRLRLVLPVPESAVPTVHIGQQMEVRVPTLNRTFTGRVARFADKISTATRTMDTEVEVPNPGLVLIPGMYAVVNLTLDNRARVLTVPIPAVDSTGEGTGRVSVVTSDNQIAVRDVKTGQQDAANIEILSGLAEGDLVVTGNRASLKPGQQVRPKLQTS